MNIFKFDSPVMNLIGKIADFIILNILCLICSIPIVTFGAAYSAKYYVSMRIIRGEEGTLFKPYFKAFAENFKKSTIAWLIQLVIMGLIGADWFWIVNKGIGNVNNIYLILLGILSLLVVFVTITIFPFFARFDIKIGEAFKGAVLFSILYFIKLFLIVALEVITVIACLWYAQWLPLILVFGTTSAYYFMNLTLVKGFSKIEKGLEKKTEEAANKAEEARAEAEGNADIATESADENVKDEESSTVTAGGNVKETEKATSDDNAGKTEVKNETAGGSVSRTVAAKEESEEYMILRPDEHTLKGKFEVEKQTFNSLSGKEKAQFFKDYYLGKTIIIACLVLFVIWFFYDAVIAKKEMVYSGGLLYCEVTEEGREYLTDGLLKELVGSKIKRKKDVNLSDDLSLDFDENEHEIEADPTQEEMLWPMIMAGYYDYFLIDAKLIEHYEHLDCFKDISEYAYIYGIPLEDCYYSLPEGYDELSRDDANSEGDAAKKESEDDKTEGTYINAIKLPESVCEKIGVYSRSGEGVYLVLILNTKDKSIDDAFMNYLFK